MLSSFLYKLEKNTTIRAKLLMGFGVVLFGTLIIGCISIYGYQVMGNSTSYLYNKSISGVSEAKGLQTEIINLENELTNLMLASTISDKKLAEQIKADSSAKIAASIEKIKVTIHHVHRKAIFDAGWTISIQKNAHIPMYAALFLNGDRSTCTQIWLFP